MTRGNELVAINITEHGRVEDILWSDVSGKKMVYLRHLRHTYGNKPLAAKRTKVSYSTVQAWRRADEAFRREEADVVIEATGAYQRKIHLRAMKGDLKANIFLLERMNPEFAPSATLEITEAIPRPTLRPAARVEDLPVFDPDRDREDIVDGDYRPVSEDGAQAGADAEPRDAQEDLRAAGPASDGADRAGQPDDAPDDPGGNLAGQ